MSSFKTEVWDTYVKRKDGSVLHFDIIVQDGVYEPEKVFAFGATFLESKNEPAAMLDARHCRLCHLETLKSEWEEALKRDGYFILEMEEIPFLLPENPTRRQMILHLRAHDESMRFADFRNTGDEALRKMIDNLAAAKHDKS